MHSINSSSLVLKSHPRTMKHKLYFFCLLLLVLKNSFASTNTATNKAYCYSFQLEAIQFPILETTIHFTTYGARDNYHHIVPMNNLYQAVSAITAIVNDEVKPDKMGSQTYRADYLSQDDAGLDDHGTLNLSIPNVDGDLNGVPDFLQQEKSVSITVSGTLDSKWSSGGPEWVGSHPVTFTFTRSAGNHAGTYSGSLSGDDGQSYPFNGSWYVINKSGTVAYDGAGSQTTTTTSAYSDGTSASFSGTGSYTVESEDEMTFAGHTITSVSKTLKFNSLRLTRQGRQYSGASTFKDGNPSTNWVDFENWKVFITDTNDYDSDGIPDLTDPEPTSSGNDETKSSSYVPPGGWYWFGAYPWAYSYLENGWLYCRPTSDGLYMYSVQNKTWSLYPHQN